MDTPNLELSPQAQRVSFTESELIVELVDGRRISVPLARLPRLAGARRTHLEYFEILGNGEGIYWPEIDHDVNLAALLNGTR